jgi:glucan biosynthesis protein C
MHQRYVDIDWLRILAMLWVFLFHVARLFDPIPWHVQNAETSNVVLMIVIFLGSWGLTVFFVISGVASWFSLSSKSVGHFIVNRIKRLLVPLYTVGAFVLIPPQYYWDQVSKGEFHGTFWQSYVRYLGTFHLKPDLEFMSFWCGHLWFLGFLFVISILTLPLMICGRTRWWPRVVGKLVSWVDWPGGLLVGAIPITLFSVIAQPIAGVHSWRSLLVYASFFLVGFIMTSDERFRDMMKRDALWGLLFGSLAFAIGTYLMLQLGWKPWEAPLTPNQSLIFYAVAGLNMWCWILFLFGMGARYLTRPSPLLVYGTEAVLPFYVLHQTIILWIAWYVVPLDLSIFWKFATISILSFSLTMAIYELMIKRFNAIRFLFGLPAQR